MRRFFAKDFILTGEGLAFAVVDSTPEEGRVLCFLRYVREAGIWRKIETGVANTLLTSEYPHYFYYSAQKDAHLHAVPSAAVAHHYRPRERLQNLLQQIVLDPVQQDLAALCRLYRQAGLPLTQFGVTGSLLIGAQHADSDIDLVIYDRDCFRQARTVTKQLLKNGALQHLDAAAWRDAYDRRCCALSLDEYIWHERRKYNKACINGRKFDLSFVAGQAPELPRRYRKLGKVALQARVKDARYAFDYPATLLLEHPEITACVSYTATYNGQAEHGEWVSVRGLLEESECGERRIVVGSSREAHGEYIKVVATHG
jgi:predicted nucleotidyltransferase